MSSINTSDLLFQISFALCVSTMPGALLAVCVLAALCMCVQSRQQPPRVVMNGRCTRMGGGTPCSLEEDELLVTTCTLKDCAAATLTGVNVVWHWFLLALIPADDLSSSRLPIADSNVRVLRIVRI